MTEIHYKTKINGVTVTLYTGLDGYYHVTREDAEWEHDHEIFDDFDKAKAFFDSLVEIEREKEIDSMRENVLPEASQRLKELMKDYVFLKKADDSEDVYYAIDSAKIETMNLCDTYDQFGQKVGHTDAGDYHPDNSASTILDDCLDAITEKFKINTGDIEFDEDNDLLFPEDNYPENMSEIRAYAKTWIDEHKNETTCEGFTFWNGHNWQTIITACDQDSAITHQVVDDETLVAELAWAIVSREFVKEKFGEKVYKSDNGYYVIDSYVQGAWEAYRIVPEAEYEYQIEQKER